MGNLIYYRAGIYKKKGITFIIKLIIDSKTGKLIDDKHIESYKTSTWEPVIYSKKSNRFLIYEDYIKENKKKKKK